MSRDPVRIAGSAVQLAAKANVPLQHYHWAVAETLSSKICRMAMMAVPVLIQCQYSSASMTVSTRVVTVGSLGSGECIRYPTKVLGRWRVFHKRRLVCGAVACDAQLQSRATCHAGLSKRLFGPASFDGRSAGNSPEALRPCSRDWEVFSGLLCYVLASMTMDLLGHDKPKTQMLVFLCQFANAVLMP